jgi:hypothetical protein
MKAKKSASRNTHEGASAVRASISFPPGLYDTLERIAKDKKVSLAWVVRDAAEKYLAPHGRVLPGHRLLAGDEKAQP